MNKLIITDIKHFLSKLKEEDKIFFIPKYINDYKLRKFETMYFYMWGFWESAKYHVYGNDLIDKMIIRLLKTYKSDNLYKKKCSLAFYDFFKEQRKNYFQGIIEIQSISYH